MRDHRTVVNIAGNWRKTYDAKIIGTDPRSDLAVIKIEGDNFPFVQLGDSSKLNVGDWVININATMAAGEPVGWVVTTVASGVTPTFSAWGRSNQLKTAGSAYTASTSDKIPLVRPLHPSPLTS